MVPNVPVPPLPESHSSHAGVSLAAHDPQPVPESFPISAINADVVASRRNRRSAFDNGAPLSSLSKCKYAESTLLSFVVSALASMQIQTKLSRHPPPIVTFHSLN